MRILGLDEAGRGSVLGPLVVGGFLYSEEEQGALKAAGANDSKVLSAARRRSIRERLRAIGTEAYRVVPATRIDEANINLLEEEAFLSLVAELRPDRVYLDAPVHPGGIPKLRARLIARSGVADWVVECKADGTYPVVGAASIVAKTERDAAIETLSAAELAAGNPGIGSGYPSDPATRSWLAAALTRPSALPPFVRTRWGTIEALRQQTLFRA